MEIEPKKIIITGTSGLIGSRFLELTAHNPSGIDINKSESTRLTHSSSLNLVSASQQQIEETLESHNGEVVVHFAGYTNVDEAEKQKGSRNEICWQLNVEATQKVTQAAEKLGLKIIYISTDFVFDGKNGPYNEEDLVAQSQEEIGWYAQTKLEGEKIVQNANTPHLIIRLSYPFRANFIRTDFVRGMIDGFKNKTLTSRFDNQYLTPVFVDDIAMALDYLISEDQLGIWHVVGNTRLTPYDAAREVAEVFGFDASSLERGDIYQFQKEHPELAPRPINGGLENSKINSFLANFQKSMQNFKDALKIMKSQMEQI